MTSRIRVSQLVLCSFLIFCLLFIVVSAADPAGNQKRSPETATTTTTTDDANDDAADTSSHDVVDDDDGANEPELFDVEAELEILERLSQERQERQQRQQQQQQQQWKARQQQRQKEKKGTESPPPPPPAPTTTTTSDISVDEESSDADAASASDSLDILEELVDRINEELLRGVGDDDGTDAVDPLMKLGFQLVDLDEDNVDIDDIGDMLDLDVVDLDGVGDSDLSDMVDQMAEVVKKLNEALGDVVFQLQDGDEADDFDDDRILLSSSTGVGDEEDDEEDEDELVEIIDGDFVEDGEETGVAPPPGTRLHRRPGRTHPKSNQEKKKKKKKRPPSAPATTASQQQQRHQQKKKTTKIVGSATPFPNLAQVDTAHQLWRALLRLQHYLAKHPIIEGEPDPFAALFADHSGRTGTSLETPPVVVINPDGSMVVWMAKPGGGPGERIRLVLPAEESGLQQGGIGKGGLPPPIQKFLEQQQRKMKMKGAGATTGSGTGTVVLSSERFLESLVNRVAQEAFGPNEAIFTQVFDGKNGAKMTAIDLGEIVDFVQGAVGKISKGNPMRVSIQEVNAEGNFAEIEVVVEDEAELADLLMDGDGADGADVDVVMDRAGDGGGDDLLPVEGGGGEEGEELLDEAPFDDEDVAVDVVLEEEEEEEEGVEGVGEDTVDDKAESTTTTTADDGDAEQEEQEEQEEEELEEEEEHPVTRLETIHSDLLRGRITEQEALSHYLTFESTHIPSPNVNVDNINDDTNDDNIVDDIDAIDPDILLVLQDGYLDALISEIYLRTPAPEEEGGVPFNFAEGVKRIIFGGLKGDTQLRSDLAWMVGFGVVSEEMLREAELELEGMGEVVGYVPFLPRLVAVEEEEKTEEMEETGTVVSVVENEDKDEKEPDEEAIAMTSDEEEETEEEEEQKEEEAISLSLPFDFDPTSTSLILDFFASIAGSPESRASLGYRHLHGLLGSRQSCESAIHYYSMASSDQFLYLNSEFAGGVPETLVTYRVNDPEAFSQSDAQSNMADYLMSITNNPAGNFIRGLRALGGGNGPNNVGPGLQRAPYGAEQALDDAPENLEQANVAQNFFLEAGEQGQGAAYAQIGRMYEVGMGVAVDNATAFEYYKKGAAMKNPSALNGLGRMFFHGLVGGKRDYQKAFQYYNASASQGDAEGRFHVGLLYHLGVPKRDNKKALENFRFAAGGNFYPAHHVLGEFFQMGTGTKRSCTDSVRHYRKFIEFAIWSRHGSNAAALYRDGDYGEALLRFLQMAAQGDSTAQFNAAYMIERGLGTEIFPSPESAVDLSFEFYRRAAALGNREAIIKLADFYYYGGHGVNVSYKRAVKYYSAAAKSFDAVALYSLGYMQEFGLGTPADFFMAKRSYEEALKRNPNLYPVVGFSLVRLYARWGIKLVRDLVRDRKLGEEKETVEAMLEKYQFVLFSLGGCMMWIVYVTVSWIWMNPKYERDREKFEREERERQEKEKRREEQEQEQEEEEGEGEDEGRKSDQEEEEGEIPDVLQREEQVSIQEEEED